MNSVVTTKGQVVIPMDLRTRYGIQKGTRIHFTEEKGRIYLVPFNEKLIDQYAGSLKGGKGSVITALSEERRKERVQENKKTKRGAKQ